ncbi:MAG TPA: hypothetical protein VMF69_03360 [Gemmataceae bacterium]|nr:hypothetical protein [Gemmataceae bacterium]
MHIHALKLSVTEQELNELVALLPAGKNSVQNLCVRLTPDGIVVLGEYPTMLMRMNFETLWEVKGIGSIVEARLASVKVAGLPASMLRAVLLKTLRDLLAREPGVRVADECIHIDLNKHTAIQKLRLHIHLTAVQCGQGSLVIEAGPSLVG